MRTHMTIRRLFGVGAIALPAAIFSFAGKAEARTTANSRSLAAFEEKGPADSLYRLGRDAINRNDFRRAAAIFQEISARYPKSEYAADAPYWRAFALYKVGREENLREALKALDTQQALFPKAS